MKIHSRTPLSVVFVVTSFLAAAAQQPAEQHAGINDAAVALDSQGAPALEVRLLTTTLNGSEDSPITNVRLQIKNITPNFYSYVTGIATFYNANGVRCGEGMFKLDALAAGESAETDTPGLRLSCPPAGWRVIANNLLMRTPEMSKPAEPPPPPPEPTAEKPAPVNFIISIDGEQHPIQLNNPIVLKLGNKNRKIVLKPIQ